MTSAYQQQLAQQLRAAEDELGRWRRQGHRADRYRAAWLSARRRAAETTAALDIALDEGVLSAALHAISAELRTAEARIAAVRAAHQRFEDRCGDCYNPDYPEPWPCPTIRALDGTEARP
jgi:hypothetical protein